MNDKAFTILNLRSFVGIFSDYGCENTEKSVSLTDSDVQTLLAEEENQNTTDQKNRKLRIPAVALVMAFLAAENVNRQLENMLQAAFGCLPERFLSVRTKSITETFECWKLGPLFVFVVIQSMFPSWALTPTHFTIFIRGLSILLFSFTNNVDFSCQ